MPYLEFYYFGKKEYVIGGYDFTNIPRVGEIVTIHPHGNSPYIKEVVLNVNWVFHRSTVSDTLRKDTTVASIALSNLLCPHCSNRAEPKLTIAGWDVVCTISEKHIGIVPKPTVLEAVLTHMAFNTTTVSEKKDGKGGK
jgi:hypothetical protein